MDSVSELQEIERQCVEKFRAKAAALRADDPKLSARIAFARAVTLLPRTADRYHFCRQRLGAMSIPSIPLR